MLLITFKRHNLYLIILKTLKYKTLIFYLITVVLTFLSIFPVTTKILTLKIMNK